MNLFMKYIFHKLRNNLPRTVLTSLQIALGVFTLIMLLSLVSLLIKVNTDENLLVLNSGNRSEDKFSTSVSVKSDFRYEHVKKMRDLLGDQETVITPILPITPKWIEIDDFRYEVSSIISTDQTYKDLMDLKLISGNFLLARDVEKKTKSIVISEQLSKQIFGIQNSIGKSIKVTMYQNDELKVSEYEVVGIFHSPYTFQVYNKPHLFIPDLITDQSFSQILIKGANDTYMRELEVFCREQGIEFFFAPYEDQEKKSIKEALSNLLLYVTAFVLIAILVSCMGVFNTTMVNVVQREKELGLFRAFGASKGTILGQMIKETLTMSIIGGIIGFIFAIVGNEFIIKDIFLNYLFDVNPDFRITIDYWIYPSTFAIISIISVIASVYPVFQYNEKSPIESIRV